VKVGIALIIVFGYNLLDCLFSPLLPGEPIGGLISGIIFSSLMITWGVWRIRGHYGKRRAREAGSAGEVQGD